MRLGDGLLAACRGSLYPVGPLTHNDTTHEDSTIRGLATDLLKTAGVPRGALLVAMLIISTGGCGTEDSAGTDDASVSVPTDTGATTGDTEGTPDAGTTDIGNAPEDTTSAADTQADCPGGFSCTCTTSEDCDSGYCIDGPDGQYCTKTCADVCPTNYKCVGTSVGSDIVNLCVPTLGFVCNPCKKNAECVAPGHGGARCVDHGDAGAFCGLQCSADGECPGGYACKDVKDIAGADTKQCVLETGACQCSKAAVAKELSTICYKSVGAAKCAGERTCLADGKEDAPPGGGLSACLAETPIAEKCDGLDNDCDGETDESTCDDQNACTVDACDTLSGCKFTNKAGPCEADGTACTKGDSCQDGQCTAGPVLDCDDKNPCTMDTCDAKVGCQYKHTNAPCNADDNPCTVADTCKAGKCEQGAAKPCESGQPCVKGACSITSGQCKFTEQDGFPCDDGDPCSTGDKCAGEVCKSQPFDCDDKNACTIDSCEKVIGCKHAANKGTCEDGDPCTTGDTCAQAGGKLTCFPGKKQDCDDNNPCTTDTCDKATGCKHAGLPGTKQACYTGKAGTDSNAPCKKGVATCQADGSQGACVGEVTPKAKETCGDGVDDDCNGTADDNCGKQSFVAGGRLGCATISGTAGKHTIRGSFGTASAAGVAFGTKHTVESGFYAWLRGLK